MASSKMGRDHSITVPFGTPLTMQVTSPNLVLNDETGKPAAAAGKNVAVPASSAVINFIYTVSGTK